MKHKLFYSFFLLLFLLPRVLPAETKSNFLERLSPVYEEMLANQVFSLWHELLGQEKVGQKEKFYIIGIGETEDLLASRIVSSLERNHPEAAQWELGDQRLLRRPYGTPRNDVPSGTVQSAAVIASEAKQSEDHAPFRGVILSKLGTPETIDSLASFIGRPENEGFLLLLTDRYVNRTWLESNIEDTGLKIKTVMTECELEFVEDELGRQAVDLDFAKWRNLIYERLVRDGMNPVHAHPATDEIIQRFRRSHKSKIAIVEKPNF